jgi:hypothetical protein
MASPGLIVLPCTTTLKTPCFTDEITVNVAVEHRTEQTFLKPIYLSTGISQSGENDGSLVTNAQRPLGERLINFGAIQRHDIWKIKCFDLCRVQAVGSEQVEQLEKLVAFDALFESIAATDGERALPAVTPPESLSKNNFVDSGSVHCPTRRAARVGTSSATVRSFPL